MKLHYITISAILLSVTSCADFDKINIDPENSIYVGAGDTGNDSNDDERSTSIDFPETIPDDELAFAKENEANKKKQRRNHMSEDRKNMKEQSEPELEKVTKRLNEYLEQICPPDQKAAAQAKKKIFWNCSTTRASTRALRRASSTRNCSPLPT